jgi:hypothetical protein
MGLRKPPKPEPEHFDAGEARHRFVAALRGARIAGPMHREHDSASSKRAKIQRKKHNKKTR